MKKSKINYPKGQVKKKPPKKPAEPKKGKYGGVKTIVDGITFDSKVEARYYLLHKGTKNMKMQEKFVLTDTAKVEYCGVKKTIAKMTYSPDFTFYDDAGVLIKVVDVKGFESDSFKVKKKIFLDKYKIPIILAKWDRKQKMFIESIA